MGIQVKEINDLDNLTTITDNTIFLVQDDGTKYSNFKNAVDQALLNSENFNSLDQKIDDSIEDITDGTIMAKKAENDSDGNKILDTYLKKSSENQTINGNISITGNLTVSGESYETHLENVNIKENLILTRDGAATGLADGEVTGVQAKKYDGTNDGQLVFDNTGTARVGDINDLQALATRDEAADMVADSFVAWDGTNNKLVTPSNQPATISDTSTLTTKTYSSSFIRNLTKVYTNSSSETTTSRSVTITNFTPVNGDIVRILFTTGCYATSTSTKFKFKAGTQSSYYDVKFILNGGLIDFPNYEISGETGKYYFFKPYTTLELMWNGTNWIVLGNPFENVFSTTELPTGETWLDGKPIYKKAFYKSSKFTINTSWTTINIGASDVKQVIKANLYDTVNSSGGLVWDIVAAQVTGENLVAYCPNNSGRTGDYIILRYTKTTD